MKAITAFWRDIWWCLRHPAAPADASPYQPMERRVITADEAAGLGLVAETCDGSDGCDIHQTWHIRDARPHTQKEKSDD
ncbi:hypothetical protein DMA15_03670 [Streptomyces sp. WAC 01529]|uniref:hypothetical protein n=1 Tax=Streptomyces sp. WAC 01529 TaxID=2203205 RepID=UPI000F6F05DE|nr:hypothetical protein [Streptomyces sp. WAC 01529]AZM51792.1 hypothetical protein DMA15_03670 [Streptomyces sp. WAC 01529]